MMERKLQAFYSFINNVSGNKIKIDAYLPYSKSEVFFHMAGNVANEEMGRYKKIIKLEDAAMLSNDPGGIDFSSTKDRVQFNRSVNDTSVPSIAFPVAVPLNSFQGFEFQIIQYQPMTDLRQFLGFKEEEKMSISV